MSASHKRALLVIDLQNDYFSDGNFPLWQAEETLVRTESAIARARAQGIPIIVVQHVVEAAKGPAPFFNAGTPGVDVHPRILAAAPEAVVVTKAAADSFFETTLERELARLGVDELIICGMMTHNCITHTAISKSAEKYKVTVLGDCCTTVSEIVHKLALHALSVRVPVVDAAAVIGE